MSKERLILGSAGNSDTDAITLDINPSHKPDVIHDLNIAPWPFSDNQFTQVICHHVLEHLNDLAPVMKELYRITKQEGRIYIEVPHFSCYQANTAEHRMRFNYFTLDAYLDSGDKSWQTHDFKFRLLSREITFHKAYRRYLLNRLWNKMPKTYERFWAYIIPAEHLKFQLQPVK